MTGPGATHYFVSFRAPVAATSPYEPASGRGRVSIHATTGGPSDTDATFLAGVLSVGQAHTIFANTSAPAAVVYAAQEAAGARVELVPLMAAAAAAA